MKSVTCDLDIDVHSIDNMWLKNLSRVAKCLIFPIHLVFHEWLSRSDFPRHTVDDVMVCLILLRLDNLLDGSMNPTITSPDRLLSQGQVLNIGHVYSIVPGDTLSKLATVSTCTLPQAAVNFNIGDSKSIFNDPASRHSLARMASINHTSMPFCVPPGRL